MTGRLEQHRPVPEACSDRVEGRTRQIRMELEDSGKALRVFQERTGLIDLEAQTAAVVEVAKNIAQELALLEAKLEVLKGQFGDAQQPDRRSPSRCSSVTPLARW